MATENPYQTPQATLDTQATDVYDESSPFTINGRFGRVAYLAYGMGMYIVTMILVGIFAALSQANTTIMWIFIIPIYLVMIFLGFVFLIRRLHDLNWSAWFSLLSFIPIVNFIFIIPVLFFPGTEGPNKYGPPRRSDNTVTLVVVIVASIAIIGILAAIALPAYQGYVKRAQEAESSITQQ